MSTLDILYRALKKSQVTGEPVQVPYIEPHYVHLIRYLIEDKFEKVLTLKQVKQLLYEEGLLPDEYYFSKDYIEKWKHTKKQVNGAYVERPKGLQGSNQAC